MDTDEQLEKLKEFVRAILSAAFEASLDGSDAQDMAEKMGIIELVPYDPKTHGEHLADELGVEPGETIYEYVAWLKKEKPDG